MQLSAPIRNLYTCHVHRTQSDEVDLLRIQADFMLIDNYPHLYPLVVGGPDISRVLSD